MFVTAMMAADARPSMQEWRATAEDGRETELSMPGVPSSFAGAETVEYRTALSDPRSPGDDIAILTLRGLYAHAEVDVPGRLGGDGPIEHGTYFLPLRVPFVPHGETELAVTCHAPADRFGGVHDTDLIPDEQSVPGVWWDAAVETGPLPYLEDVSVRPERGDGGLRLRVRTSVLTGGPCSARLTYSVRPEGQSRGGGTMERGRIETDDAGRTTVEHTVALRDPAPWWPRDLGEQNRHVLRVKLGDQERTVTFGIREVSFEDDTLRVNGEPVPIRGVNLLDGDVDDVERAVEVNANLVRAHAHVPPAAVYEACDKAGLLVWQDMPLTGPGTFDLERGRDLARALARRGAGHPSVAVYAAHDDPVTVAEGLGAGLLERLRLRWQAWRVSYDPTAARDLAAALPDPAFPAVAGPGLGCDAAAYYPGWKYGDAGDMEWLLDRYPASLVAEYGRPAPGPSGDGQDGDPDAERAIQAALVGTTSEFLRRERVGAVAFCLRDADEAGCGVYGHDGQPKPARDSLERAFQPVQAFLTDPTPGDTPVVVVNDTPQTVTATLRWQAGDAGATVDVTVEGRNRWSGGPLAIPSSADAVSLELVGDALHVENSYEL